MRRSLQRRAVSSTLDVETVLDTIVSRASQLAGAEGCSIYEYDEAAEQFELRATHNDDTEFVAALRAAHLRKGEGLIGRAAEMREPIQVPDIIQPGAYQSSVRDTLVRFGYRSLLAVPLLRGDQIIGSLSFNRKAQGEFPPEVVEVLKTFATQSALAIQNARLFREIADKSAQKMDRVVVAYADPETERRRLMERDGLSDADARARIASQIPIAEKAKLAHYVIDNSGTREETERQVRTVYGALLAELTPRRRS